MIGNQQIQEILKQYEKHGWILRRVLLSARLREILSTSMFDEADVIAADFDALWFARVTANGGEAWELRSLSAAPFALVEVFEDTDEDEVREEILSEMETQMKERASKPVAQKREV